MDIPDVVDFSNDTWSYKGEPPVYQIQSDGFSYDIDDTDGNDKNAISLGLAGMLVIVLNAKSPKIKEDELLPHLGKVIKTRNWHSMTVKEANFLVQTAIKKLTSSSTSGDVFDLASYAPLEVKRSLLKTLFTISRAQLKPEFREEAEHRIIDDIVPEIFANPEYELASLTGLIVKPDPKAAEPVSEKIETKAVLDPEIRFESSEAERAADTSVNTASVDSAFAELQKIYGRKADSVSVQNAVRNNEQNAQQNVQEQEPSSEEKNDPDEAQSVTPVSVPPFRGAQPNNVFSAASDNLNSAEMNMPKFSAPQPNNPFNQSEPRNIPQPGIPNFNMPQPNMPQFNQQQNMGIPQPLAPAFNQQPGNPFSNMNQPSMPSAAPGYPQGNPYQGNNMPVYPGQMYPPQNMQNMNPQQMPYPGQMQNPQYQPGMGNYPPNFVPQQYGDSRTQQPYQPGMNYNPNFPQQMQPNDPTTRDQTGRNA